ncbi:hypothetical protein [Levilactobacillus brevis]|uniref:hypothetical protein n=1 Tax=Levilactobacillus brevis TaxID=1580 RepID=UPI003EBECD5B
MNFKNKSIIENWKTATNMPIVLDLYAHDDTSKLDLKSRFDKCDLATITGEPERCAIQKNGPYKGFQMYQSTEKGHKRYSVLALTLTVVGKDFKEFIETFLGDFYYTDGSLNELADLTCSLAEVAGKNYSAISRYGSIKNKPLKKLIGRDRDIQKVALQIYENSLALDWYCPPTNNDNDPVTRLSAKTIAQQTRISTMKVNNIIGLLRLFHAIAEVSVRDMSKPYFEKFIDLHATYLHTPIYTIYDLSDPDINWDLANQLELDGSSRISKSAIQFFFGEEYLRAMYPDQRNTSVQLVIMQKFEENISNATSISRKELLEKTSESFDESFSVIKNAWNSYRLFMPLHQLQLVTASDAAEQGIKVKNAKGREKVVIPA